MNFFVRIWPVSPRPLFNTEICIKIKVICWFGCEPWLNDFEKYTHRASEVRMRAVYFGELLLTLEHTTARFICQCQHWAILVDLYCREIQTFTHLLWRDLFRIRDALAYKVLGLKIFYLIYKMLRLNIRLKLK